MTKFEGHNRIGLPERLLIINFRCRLVSLVAIFLVLTVGIVPGAGPLAQSIGKALTGQVNRLRKSRDALSNQLAESREGLTTDEWVSDTFARRIFDRLLAGVNVAVVVLLGANGEDVKKVSEKIGQTGGAVFAQISLREEFFSLEKKTYREALPGQITQYFEDTTWVTTPEDTLAAVVGQPAFIDQNEALTRVLGVTGTPLLQVVAPAKASARVGVIIGSHSNKTKSPASGRDNGATRDKNVNPACLELAHILSFFTGGAVVFGADTTPTDLVSVIRFESTLISTINNIGSASVLLVLLFALVSPMNDTVGAWGAESRATALVPPLDQKITPGSEPPVEPSQAAPNSGQPGRRNSSPARLVPHEAPANPASQSLEARPNPRNRPETKDKT